MGKKKGKKKGKKSMIKQFGDFQSNVGRATAPVTNIGNKFGAIFMGIFGILFIFIGIKSGQIAAAGIGLFIIFLAFFVWISSDKWTKQVKKNRTAAQIQGTMFEVNMIKDIFS